LDVSEHALFIDAAGIAEYCGRSIDTVRYWERLGQLPQSAKLGRRRVWKRQEIVAHFDAMFNAA
jgi:DNA-binding transcriptional MerR regulator